MFLEDQELSKEIYCIIEISNFKMTKQSSCQADSLVELNCMVTSKFLKSQTFNFGIKITDSSFFLFLFFSKLRFFIFFLVLGGGSYIRVLIINFEGQVQSFKTQTLKSYILMNKILNSKEGAVSHGLLDLVIVLSLHVSNYSHVIKKLKISALGNRKQLVGHMSSAQLQLSRKTLQIYG